LWGATLLFKDSLKKAESPSIHEQSAAGAGLFIGRESGHIPCCWPPMKSQRPANRQTSLKGCSIAKQHLRISCPSLVFTLTTQLFQNLSFRAFSIPQKLGSVIVSRLFHSLRPFRIGGCSLRQPLIFRTRVLEGTAPIDESRLAESTHNSRALTDSVGK
jgi:hypothetical protein